MSISGTSHQVVGVVHTEEDDRHTHKSLRKLALENNIKNTSFKNNNINDTLALSTLKQFDATLFLVVQYPKIFGRSAFSIPGKACLNIHRGWPLRGGSIDQRAIYYKQSEYFIILHKIDLGIDTGDILYREPVKFNWRVDTGCSLDNKVAEAGKKLIVKGLIPRLRTGDFEGTKQNRPETKYENKWKSERRTILPEEVNYSDAERLARALNHPREEGLFLRIDRALYRWNYNNCGELINIKWKDDIRSVHVIRI